MRAPRFQISISMLLTVVAIIAVDCGVIRFLNLKASIVHGGFPLATDWFDWGVDDTEPPSIRSRSFAVGLLPLAHFALIGAVSWITWRVRSSRNSRAIDARTAPAGFAFFNNHFLALGAALCGLLPALVAVYGRVVEDPLQGAGQAFADFFPALGDSLPFFLFELTVLCVAISGPLLLLSWVGSVLARRAAGKLPRRRFRILTGLVSFGFAALVLAFAFVPMESGCEEDVALDLRVVDKESRQPIGGAFVRISDAFDTEEKAVMALAGADGRATLKCRLHTFGERNAFRAMGVFSSWGKWLEISAAGFQTLRIPLPDVIEPHVELGQSPLRSVALTRGQTPSDPFGEIAGAYIMPGSGFGSSVFAIAADGRFVWIISSCTPPFFQQYGQLKRNNGEIELVRCHHPRAENDSFLNSTIRLIEWDNELYLTAKEDRGLSDLCRVALKPRYRPDWTETFGGYVRNGDPTKPLTGLPRLPVKAVVQFVYRGLNLRNEDGILRVALESLTERESR